MLKTLLQQKAENKCFLYLQVNFIDTHSVKHYLVGEIDFYIVTDVSENRKV